MARRFLSFTLALAIAALMLLGAAATLASAQTVTVVVGSGTQWGAAAPNKYPEVQEAVQLASGPNPDMPAAIKKLEDAARKYPELPSAHVLMFQILFPIDPNAARRQLNEAVKANPSDPEPYIILGNIALQERLVADAKTDFDKAKQLLAAYKGPKERKGSLEQQTLSGIALVAESRENWEEATACLRDLLELAPRDLFAHHRLSRSLFWQGKTTEAFEVLKKAKQIDRDNARRTARGKSHHSLPKPSSQCITISSRARTPRAGMPRSGLRPLLKVRRTI